MRFAVNIRKDGPVWLAGAPLMDLWTQGKTKKNAMFMLSDAIWAMSQNKLRVHVIEDTNGFYIESKQSQLAMAFVLKRLRQARGLTLDQVAQRLNSKSPNAYGRYEQGRSAPSIEKFEELITAIDAKFKIVLNIAS